MKMITVNWSDVTGEAKVRFSKDFEASDWVLQMDCMKDAMWDIQQRYNSQIPQADIADITPPANANGRVYVAKK